jgi:hypothetical protein
MKRIALGVSCALAAMTAMAAENGDVQVRRKLEEVTVDRASETATKTDTTR